MRENHDRSRKNSGEAWRDYWGGKRDGEKREREAFLEDLIAATSPEYLSSIREARADYKMKRVKTHEEVFGKWSIDLFTPLEVSPFMVEMIKASKIHHRKGGL